MINFKESIAEKLSEIIEGLNKDEIMAMLEVPTDSKLGDYAFLVSALQNNEKITGIDSKDIAEKLDDSLIFEKVESVNAYVNMFLNRKVFMSEVIKEVADKKTNLEVVILVRTVG